MILSWGRKYLFIHSPKTGGTSMALALEARAMKDDLMLGDTPKARNRRHRLADQPARGRLWKHSTLADLDGIVQPDELSDLFCFTMVRNPWLRTLSYYHWLQDQTFEHAAVRLAQQVTFDAFVCHPDTIRSLQAAPARHYMTDARGQERCDLYIRLEHLDTDLAPLEAHLGFALTVPVANRSTRPENWRDAYSSQARATIAQACEEDIDRFGYVFGD